MSTALLHRPRRFALLAGLSAIVLLGAWFALGRSWLQPRLGFVEYKMPNPLDMPTAIAAAPDGTIWFTIDLTDVIGRLRGGKVERLPTHMANLEPIGLGIAPDGAAWYTDNAGHAITRVAPEGEVNRFPLDTASVRLGRLAVAADGAAWFAEETGLSITKFKDGVLTRHIYESARGGPYGVALAADGSVWATLQSGDQLLHISADDKMTALDLPQRNAVASDIAVAPDGSVWFLEVRADRIAHYANGTFSEIPVNAHNVGLSGLTIGRDGAIWFGMLRSGAIGRLRAGAITSFPLPRDHARPYTLTTDHEGNVWYADISGYVGMIPAADAER